MIQPNRLRMKLVLPKRIVKKCTPTCVPIDRASVKGENVCPRMMCTLLHLQEFHLQNHHILQNHTIQPPTQLALSNVKPKEIVPKDFLECAQNGLASVSMVSALHQRKKRLKHHIQQDMLQLSPTSAHRKHHVLKCSRICAQINHVPAKLENVNQTMMVETIRMHQ